MINKCIKYFLITRLFFILIIILPFNKFLIGEWDMSNSLIASPPSKIYNNNNNNNNKEYLKEKDKKVKIFNEKTTESILNFDDLSFIERNLLKFLKVFHVYDSSHFINLAKTGYTNEKNLVFFPIFPVIIQYVERITFLKYLFSFKNDLTSFLLSGFIISNLFCLLNTFLLVR